MLHGALTAAHGIHAPYTWVFANESERNGASGFTADDIGKLAYQSDDASVWVLVSASPSWRNIAEARPKGWSLAWTPYALREPSSGAAEVTTVTVGGLPWEAAAFDDTAEEHLYLEGVVPSDALGQVTLRFVGAAASNPNSYKIRWKFEVWEYGDTSPVSVLSDDRVLPTYTSGVDTATVATTLSELGLSAGARFAARVSVAAPQSGQRLAGDAYLMLLAIEGAR